MTKNIFLGILIALPVLIICLVIVFDSFFAKDLADNVKEILFWGSIVGVFVAFGLTYLLLRSFQLNSIKVQKKETEIRCLGFDNTPLLYDNSVAVYRDADYIMRISVFGYKNSSNVFCTLEEVGEDWELTKKLQSPAFSRIEKLNEQFGDFKDMIKIG